MAEESVRDEEEKPGGRDSAYSWEASTCLVVERAEGLRGELVA